MLAQKNIQNPDALVQKNGSGKKTPQIHHPPSLSEGEYHHLESGNSKTTRESEDIHEKIQLSLEDSLQIIFMTNVTLNGQDTHTAVRNEQSLNQQAQLGEIRIINHIPELTVPSELPRRNSNCSLLFDIQTEQDT